MNTAALIASIKVYPGTQKDIAARLGVSATYLGEVLRGIKEPGPKILAAMGLERVVTYQRKKGKK